MKKLLTCLFLVLSSCNPIRSGKVIDKIYEPPYSHTDTNWFEISEGVRIPVTTTTNYPAKYYLILQTEVEGKIKSGKVDVSPQTYESVHIGDMYGLEKQ